VEAAVGLLVRALLATVLTAPYRQANMPLTLWSLERMRVPAIVVLGEAGPVTPPGTDAHTGCAHHWLPLATLRRRPTRAFWEQPEVCNRIF
jgi:hypothetical protein